MPNTQPTLFPTIDEVMQLVRSIVNDTFPGISGQQGRIFTNDAPFTLPFLNSAIRHVLRRLRNEGVTFPIKDGVVLLNIPPVVQADPSVFVNVSFNGSNNGTTTSATPYLPGDLMQPYVVRQRQTGSNLQFTPMVQAQEGLPSGFQNQWLGMWEWRGYALWFNGSLQPQDIMLRYQSGQPPINAPAASFATTPIFIVDSTDAIANKMAAIYGRRNGGDAEGIKSCEADAETEIDEMAQEYIRRGQTVNYQRESYQGGGSNNQLNVSLGSTGTGN